LSANFRARGGHPPTIVGVRKLESLGYQSRGVVCLILRLAVLIHTVQSSCVCLSVCLTVCDRQLDRQTDRPGAVPRF